MRRFAAFTLTMLLAASPTLAEPFRRPGPAEIDAIRRWLCPHGGAPVKGMPGRCDRALDRRPWDTDLPAPQRDAAAACPDGTRPVLARGHNDIIRCLPS